MEEIIPVLLEVLESGGEFRIYPSGTSMLPLLRQGLDSVSLVKPSSQLKNNDIAFYIRENGNVLAYLRAFYADDSKNVVKIGRVLSIKHGIGLGADIMRNAMADIKKNMKCQKICLNSQKSAIEFYQKLGFKSVSDEFLEEGVIHVKMELEI